MNDDGLWAIIAAAGGSDDPTDGLATELRHLPDDSVIEFDAGLHGLLRRCWTEELWQLAALVVDDLDDAGFEWFRLWLVFRGRSAFEAVLADPDSLADVPVDGAGYQLDGPQYVAWKVYRGRTGSHMPARRRPPAHLRPLWTTTLPADAAQRFPRTVATGGADRKDPIGQARPA